MSVKDLLMRVEMNRDKMGDLKRGVGTGPRQQIVQLEVGIIVSDLSEGLKWWQMDCH